MLDDIATVFPVVRSTRTRSKSEVAVGHSSHLSSPQKKSWAGTRNVLASSAPDHSAKPSPLASTYVPAQWVSASLPAELTQRTPCARASATKASTGSLGSFVPRPAL